MRPLSLAAMGTLLAALAQDPAPPPLAPGIWVGRSGVGGRSSFAIMNVPREGTSAVLTLPLERKTHPLAVSLREARVLLESTDSAGLRLEGGLDQGLLVGSTGAGTFELRRVAPSEPKMHEAYTGFYRVDRRLVFLSPWSPLGVPQLTSGDDSGRVAAVYPLGDGEFVVGAGFLALFPEKARLRFVAGKGGRPTGLVWREGGQEWEAPRVPLYEEEAVEFSNGDVKLAGMLLVPRTPAPHPAIVLVHGSGPQDRFQMLLHAAFLLRHGVALLAYDKRGVGASGGDWRTAAVADLAEDATAATRWLRQRPDIRPDQVGLLGLSEGGWTAPLAASRSHEAAFVITLAGPAVTPAELDNTNVRHALEQQGVAGDDLEQALELKRLSDRFAGSGEGWEAFLAGYEHAAGRPWQATFRYAGAPPSRDSWYWRYWGRMMAYDPLPVLRRLRTPVLAILGQYDLTVRPDANAPRWEEATKEAGNREASVVVLPRANHPLLEVEHGELREMADSTRFAPGLQSTVLEWLRARRVTLVPAM